MSDSEKNNLCINDNFTATSCNFADINFHFISKNNRVIFLSFSADHHQEAIQSIESSYSSKCKILQSDHKALCDFFRSYFHGEPLACPYDLAPFFSLGTPFQQEVWKAISSIPYGETSTYGEIAAKISHKDAARAVGQACNANPLALIIPCHRVVGAKGLGGFAGGLSAKRKLLELEKHRIETK